MKEFLPDEFSVVNVGLERFADDLKSFNVDVLDLNWEPPGTGSPDVARCLSDLADDVRGLGKKIKNANEEAFDRLIRAQPVLRDIVPAREALDDVTETTFLHAGPPVVWGNMCGAMRGAVIGGLMYEGLATSEEKAKALAASGAVHFAPCHSRSAVGPMAGVITPSMPVMVVEDEEHHTIGYATMNEGWGRTLRFGAFDQEVIDRLKWMESELAAALRSGIHHLGGVDIKAIISRALHMGDECHNRDLAATSLFYKEIAPAIVKAVDDVSIANGALEFISNQEHFFLNIGMAACKASLLAASNIPYSTMVTAIARNGVDVGLLLSSTDMEWFTAPATIPDGLFFPNYSKEDANPDLGDSAITETAGIGAFAMAGAPAIVRFVGGTPADARRFTEEMYRVTIGENPNFSIPALGFRGTPTGIDIRAVIESGITPVVNTGIAHLEPGHGLVGAGVARLPMAAFEKALEYVHSLWTG